MQLKKAHLLYINFFVLLSVLASAQPQTVDGVAAIVGGDVILKSDIDEQYDVFNRQNFGKPVSYCEVFEELLFQKLLIHHAAIDSISIGEEEVEANMDRRIQQLIMQMGDQKKLEDFYEKSVVEIKEDMRTLIKEQLTAQRMQMTVVEGIEVTPSEVREYYENLPADSIPLISAEVELSQIVKFPELSDEAEQEVIAKLKELKERIENGTSFSSMAILYSEDPGSNKKGGEYQGIQRGVFVKEFEAVAFNLRKGEISDPFKTEFGYHIVQLLEKRGEELDLRHILIKPKLTQENLQEAKNFLDSVSVAITNGEMTFEEASRRFSDDEQTRFNGGQMSNFQSGNNKFEVSQLDRGLFALISSLEDDEISEASFYRTEDQREAFRIVRLDANYEPHKANLDLDFTRIKGFALQQKQAKTVEDWKNEKLADTFVKINEGYYDCADELNSWNSNND
ncbi:MAG: peptidylprolyl isomerase [Cryomorphaceae bacterium]|jgi:peptidyl-prolyl cis-trans isomerase SurA|nr:peptidylprolyl isomerase [Cryomorphaceae bacterium]MDA8581294.1 peptidylprolyl isomerase [Schleiferiaceae bacterium]MBL6682492.1 peptidylprolyl isomerase [Cryomorphaceae bacterium]MBL6867933.1 peptidylprolyl isomerase [Cryomorphaceae bacterium]MDA9147840.1 peptidylprolyl isomerase [Schleiferiaceae bacterium]